MSGPSPARRALEWAGASRSLPAFRVAGVVRRWVSDQGPADFVTAGADAHIDRLARKYLGQDSYPFRRPGEERVIVRVTRTQKLGMG